MPSIRIEGFAGIAPRVSARLLPSSGAVVAQNAKLLSGELRGLHELKLVEDFTGLLPTVVRRAFRIPNDEDAPIPIGSSDFWVPFSDAEVDFINTPVSNDSYDRYYWTGDSTVYSGVPKYNTRARILNGDPSYRLGVPTPATGMTVTPPAGSDRTRSYVYTFVTTYGEEGPPSPATLAIGTDGTWELSDINAAVPNSSERTVVTKRIYRTVPGNSSSEFYFVADIAVASTTYSDTSTDDDVAANVLLTSTTWTEPPATLQGVTVHPGGFLIGFTGRDLWLSEPYRPHAWPAQYVISVEAEIVGAVVYGDSILLTTRSRPYIVHGANPISMAPTKIDSVDPCVSRRSMVSTLDGVYYASPQGIVLMNNAGVRPVSHSLFTREEWYTRYNPLAIRAVQYGMQYIAFDQANSGFIYSPAEQLSPLCDLDRFDGVEMIQTDRYSGDVYVIRHNQVLLWDPPDTIPYYYTWKSKEFDFPEAVNFGALRLKFNNPGTVQLEDEAVAHYSVFNTARIAADPEGLVAEAFETDTPEDAVGFALDNSGGGYPQLGDEVGPVDWDTVAAAGGAGSVTPGHITLPGTLVLVLAADIDGIGFVLGLVDAAGAIAADAIESFTINGVTYSTASADSTDGYYTGLGYDMRWWQWDTPAGLADAETYPVTVVP